MFLPLRVPFKARRAYAIREFRFQFVASGIGHSDIRAPAAAGRLWTTGKGGAAGFADQLQ
jgi:hypothetical protein